MAKSKVKAQLFMQYAASFDAMGGTAWLDEKERAGIKADEAKDDESQQAIIYRKIARVGKSITKDIDDVNIESAIGQTPLDWAVYFCLSDVAHKIIEAGGDINHINPLEQAPYIKSLCARPYTKASQVQLVIDLNADINAGDHEGYSPITHAIWNQRDDLIKLLVAARADIDRVQPKTEKSYLMELLSKEANTKDEHVVITVKNGANVHAEDEYGHRAAEWAMFRMFPKALESILEANGDINRENPKQAGLTYLGQVGTRVLKDGNKEQESILKFIVEHKANVNKPVLGGNTIFELAMTQDKTDLLKAIVASSTFKSNAPLSSGLTPHAWAEAEGMDDLVRIMDQFHPCDTELSGAGVYDAAAGSG